MHACVGTRVHRVFSVTLAQASAYGTYITLQKHFLFSIFTFQYIHRRRVKANNTLEGTTVFTLLYWLFNVKCKILWCLKPGNLLLHLFWSLYSSSLPILVAQLATTCLKHGFIWGKAIPFPRFHCCQTFCTLRLNKAVAVWQQTQFSWNCGH